MGFNAHWCGCEGIGSSVAQLVCDFLRLDAQFYSQHFNEIMPVVYKRFAESQKNWRQIYKVERSVANVF